MLGVGIALVIESTIPCYYVTGRSMRRTKHLQVSVGRQSGPPAMVLIPMEVFLLHATDMGFYIVLLHDNPWGPL